MKKNILTTFLILILFTLSSCGTLLKFTEVGKEKTNNLDFLVVFADVIGGGMLTFFTSIKIAQTGVFFIAPILVDFITGSIYIKQSTTSIDENLKNSE